jgi:hypothetical protein
MFLKTFCSFFERNISETNLNKSLANGGSTMAGHWTHHPKVKGSRTAHRNEKNN